MQTNLPTLDEARKAERDARAAVDAIEGAAKAEARKAYAAVEAAFLVDHDIEGARERLRSAAAILAEAENRLPAHEWDGRRVFKMRNVGPGYAPQHERIEGVVETRRHGTPFPGNTSRYSLPKVGDGFVRLLNKSGQPGARFDTLGRAHSWKLAEEQSNAD